MYSVLASLNQVTSFMPSTYTPLPATQLPVQTGKTPTGSSTPNTASSYLSPVFPPCVPVSVYIDGTNTADASGWVSPSDYANIDPAAIEGFTSPDNVPEMPSMDDMIRHPTKSVQGHMANIKGFADKNVKALKESVKKAKKSMYTSKYGPPTSDNGGSGGGMAMPELLTAFVNYHQDDYKQASTSPTSTAPIIPFKTVLDVLRKDEKSNTLTDTNAQNLVTALLKATSTDRFTNIVTQDLTQPVNPVEHEGEGDGYYQEQLAAYNNTIQSLDTTYRSNIIDAMMDFDNSATSTTTEAFQLQYSSVSAAYPPLDMINHFYIAALIGVGLYMFYCMYKKHEFR
jgi:hypothetical protein